MPAVKRPCNPTEVALKSYFLGPNSENAEWLSQRFAEILERWFVWRRESFPQDGTAICGADMCHPEFLSHQQKVSSLLAELIERFEGELPKFSPRYVGHMFSEISMPALLGHVLTLLHNPNIIARESATVATIIENEAIAELGRMLGQQRSFGHFTSGGTVANYEGVVRAKARLHQWQAAAAAARCQGAARLSPFEAAQLGWEGYNRLRQTVSEDQLAPFLAERAGPIAAARAMERVWGEPLREPAMIVPRSSHYSWIKAARLFGVGDDNLHHIDPDLSGHYRVELLRKRLLRCHAEGQPVMAVVSIAGSTETGGIDPCDEISELLRDLREQHGWHIWHHVDAAYGGFFCSMLRTKAGFAGAAVEAALPPFAARALGSLGKADSITVDPHKLGYVPYSSGAFLAADLRDYTCVKVLAPYLDYRPQAASDGQEGQDRGPYTLEGSRSAGGAVATWLTARSIGLDQSGYGLLLARTIAQREKVQEWLTEHLGAARIYPGCDTNVLCFCIADAGEAVSATNRRTLRLLSRLAIEAPYYLTKTELPLDGARGELSRHFVSGWSAAIDEAKIVMLRMCLMNPFFDSSELDTDHVARLVFAIAELAD
jgi:glutamate/tyrosine decarboxylase-like PLP-dependent enzyme